MIAVSEHSYFITVSELGYLITVSEFGYLITVSELGYLITQLTRLLNYSQWTRLHLRVPTKNFTATFAFLANPSGNVMYNDPLPGVHKFFKI